MRPVDLLPNKPHAFYDQTFDNLSADRLLIVKDLSWKRLTLNNTFLFFSGTYNWGPNKRIPTKPDSVAAVPADAAPHLFATYDTPQISLGVRNSRNTGTATLRPRFLSIQKSSGRCLRLGVRPDEASDAVAAWNDGLWNTVPIPPATLSNRVFKLLRKQVQYTDTVPNEDVGVAPGTFRGYRGAVRDLELAGGGYCAYCESKRQDARTMAVEHRLPKKYYHSEILRWQNFLVACEACNSSFKGSKPNRAFGIQKAISHYAPAVAAGITYPGVPPQNRVSPVVPSTGARVPYSDMRQACEWYVLWPSQDDGGSPNCPVVGANPANPTNYGLAAMHYKLREFHDNGTLIGDVSDDDAVNTSNVVLRDVGHGMVRANVWDSTLAPPRLRERNVRVDAVPTAPTTPNALFNTRKQQAAQTTADMVGLNALANALGDRRQLERTRAWFHAIESYATIQGMKKKYRDKLWKPLLNQAEAGYYSVWLTVIRKASGRPRARSLATRLKARADAGGTPYRYHGTNIANSVLPFIDDL
jgi:5-methylcytosine-specific restriction endonuclease McrA